MDKNDSYQSRERERERERKRRKYSSSGFYDNHADGHTRRSKERTNTDAKTDSTVASFSVKILVLSSP
jgi:hypothetical protein